MHSDSGHTHTHKHTLYFIMGELNELPIPIKASKVGCEKKKLIFIVRIQCGIWFNKTKVQCNFLFVLSTYVNGAEYVMNILSIEFSVIFNRYVAIVFQIVTQTVIESFKFYHWFVKLSTQCNSLIAESSVTECINLCTIAVILAI